MKKVFAGLAVALAVVAGVVALPNDKGTPAAKATDPTEILDFYIAGDWCDPAHGGTLTQCEATADAIIADMATRSGAGASGVAIICAGDCDQDDGSYQSYLDGWDTYVQDTLDTAEINHFNIAVPGNHEYQTTDADGYRDYWPDTQASDLPWSAGGQNFAPSTGSLLWKRTFADGASGYAVNGNVVTFIGIDTTKVDQGGPGLASGSDQYQELKSALVSAESPCTVVVGHHPRWASPKGGQGSNTFMGDAWSLMSDTTPSFPMDEDLLADVYVSGHVHVYERFDRMDETGTSTGANKGTRQFVVGTGGDTQGGTLGTQLGTSQARVQDWGFLRLSFRWTGTGQAEYTWEFIDDSNNTDDYDESWYECWDGNDD